MKMNAATQELIAKKAMEMIQSPSVQVSLRRGMRRVAPVRNTESFEPTDGETLVIELHGGARDLEHEPGTVEGTMIGAALAHMRDVLCLPQHRVVGAFEDGPGAALILMRRNSHDDPITLRVTAAQPRTGVMRFLGPGADWNVQEAARGAWNDAVERRAPRLLN